MTLKVNRDGLRSVHNKQRWKRKKKLWAGEQVDIDLLKGSTLGRVTGW